MATLFATRVALADAFDPSAMPKVQLTTLENVCATDAPREPALLDRRVQNAPD